jgi:hypothetical protein
MTLIEFNTKYKDYLATNHIGLAIDNKAVIQYLDKEFTHLVKNNAQPFKYYQIKTKYNYVCCYCNASTPVIRILENNIKKILDNEPGSNN